MRRRIRFLLLLALAASLVGVAGTPARAQDGADRIHAIARVYESGPEAQSYLSIFGPDGSNPGKLIVASDQQAELSGDGRWIATSGFDQARNADVLEYRPVNGRPTAIPVDAGYSVLSAHFSRDARMLMYTLASLEPRQWILGLLELETGRKIEFIRSAGDDSALGAGQIGSGLDLLGERLYVSAFLPFAGGNFGGIFAIDLIGLDAAVSGRYALPDSVQQLLPGGTFVYSALSPNGALLAYLTYDEGNPPQNYNSFGPAMTFNVLRVLDLTSGEAHVLAQAGPGQGLDALSWTPDSANVLFAGGNYGGRYYIAAPHLYSVDIATVTVIERGAYTTDTAEVIGDLLACGDTLYSVSSIEAADGARTATLYAAPLANPTERALLVAGSTVFLQSCAAPITGS